MKYILQFFTGTREITGFRAEEIIGKVDELASRMEIDRIIIGWAVNLDAYRQIGAYLHEKGIRMLLWLPVFSEVGEELQPDLALDVFGAPVGMPDTEDGGFRFVCPSSVYNARLVRDTYEQFFAHCGFDGVFLDRIRGQSFAAGVSGVLSCACERCRMLFLEKGVDLRAVRTRYEEREDAFFDVASWPMNGEFRLRDTLAQRFFEAREEIVSDAVAGLCQYFREKGLTVGLDLFAPVVSRIVGQNYTRITRYADFIKPMLYRRTDAPAGIGYEYELFRKCAPKARGLDALSLDQAFLHTQLQAMENLPCGKYPGIEVNYDGKLVKTDPEYIRESQAAVRDHGFQGATLCWNITQAPVAHLEAAASL